MGKRDSNSREISPPTLEFQDLKIRQEALILTNEDLAFTEADVKEFFKTFFYPTSGAPVGNHARLGDCHHPDHMCSHPGWDRGFVDCLSRPPGRGKRPDGSQEVIKRLGPGDHFGEMAVLRNARRSATVRAVTPVQVFSMSPANFFSLYTNLPGLREQIDRILQARLQDLNRRP